MFVNIGSNAVFASMGASKACAVVMPAFPLPN
jgi:hypothetical protein